VCFCECKSLNEVIFESESKLKEIGQSAFRDSGLSGSIRIPNSVEKLGPRCFCGCRDLCEVIFESRSKLKEIGKKCFEFCFSLKCVKVEVGFNVKYDWPKDCRIEYIPNSRNEEGDNELNISDYN
jgi:hypothetical protein